jgi:sugar lactone lactonase YvrE
MTRNRILRAAMAVVLLTSASALAQAPDQAPAGGRGAGRGTRPPRVHTLSPGPDLGYGYDINPLSLPSDVTCARQFGGVAMNSQGHIFVFHRATAGKPQVLEFDANQKFVRGFAEDIAVRAHGIRIDTEDNIWLCDQGGNVVIKMNPQREVVMRIGERGMPGLWDEAAGRRLLFNPTDLAFAPNGDIYIAQGHGSESPSGFPASVLHLNKDGRFIAQWRGDIEGPGKFAMAHSIVLDARGNLYLADREDKRIVVYDSKGRFVKAIQMANLVCAFMVAKDGSLWMANGQDGQVEKIDWDGNVLGWSGIGPGNGPGQFGESSYMVMDAKGDIYVSDTSLGRVQKLIKRN